MWRMQLTFISLCESWVRKQTSILIVFENEWKAYSGEEQIVDLLSSESARRKNKSATWRWSKTDPMDPMDPMDQATAFPSTWSPWSAGGTATVASLWPARGQPVASLWPASMTPVCDVSVSWSRRSRCGATGTPSSLSWRATASGQPRMGRDCLQLPAGGTHERCPQPHVLPLLGVRFFHFFIKCWILFISCIHNAYCMNIAIE